MVAFAVAFTFTFAVAFFATFAFAVVDFAGAFTFAVAFGGLDAVGFALEGRTGFAGGGPFGGLGFLGGFSEGSMTTEVWGSERKRLP